MSSELPAQIRSQLQKLADKQGFADSLEQLLVSALQALSCQPAPPTACPSALLLALAHCLSLGTPLSALAPELPASVQPLFLGLLEKHQPPPPVTFVQPGVEELVDVEWQVDISTGRELWQVGLKFEGGRQMRMVLNYEMLSVLVFKLGQVVGYGQGCQI